MLSTWYGAVTVLIACGQGSPPDRAKCSSVSLEPLVAMSACVTEPRLVNGYTAAKCEAGENNTVFVSVIEEIPDLTDKASTSLLCTGLLGFERTQGRKSWYATFDPGQPTGVMTVDSACWRKQKNALCILEVRVLSSIWSLPVVQHHPETIDFWNFQAPVFLASRRWLRALELSECLVRKEWLSGLQNTSIAKLTVYRGDPGSGDLLLPRLPSLKRLVVTRSGLTEFDTRNFLAVPNVEQLVLSRNTFNGIPRGISQVKKLKLLDVSQNYGNAFFIPTEEMEELVNLENINLANNVAITNFTVIKQIPYLPNLKYLNLSHCRIQSIDGDDDPFKNFPKLQKLDLSRNQLLQWDPNFLIHRKIIALDLSRNYFTEWPILKGCKIELLSLSFNKLYRMVNFGEHGTSINYLDVSLNNISEWQDKGLFLAPGTSIVFEKYIMGNTSTMDSREDKTRINPNNNVAEQQTKLVHPKSWVDHVDLSANNIHAVTEEMTDSMSVLKTVDLEGNPFDCTDCSIPEFVKWMRESQKVNSSKRLLCESPYTEYEEKVIEANSYEDLCFPKKSSTAVVAMGNFLAICLLMIVFVILTVYWYRFEISYTFHLFKIRNSRHRDQYNKYLYDAFICYSGRDRPWVMRTLVPTLENGPEKYRLCLHDRDFVLGSMIVENIVHSIEKSRRVVIVLSKHFVKSRWCQWELDMANHKSFEDSSSFLILIQLEQLDRQTLPRHLKFLMDTRTYLEWPKNPATETNTDVVFRRLRSAMGPSICQVAKKKETLSIEASV